MERSSYSASQLDIISFCDAIDESRAVMTDRDKHVYNILSRSAATKPTFSSLALHEAEKSGILQKTGPCPRWYSSWRKREFVLKGNFLYYYKPSRKNIDNVVLGAAYIRGAAIDTSSMKGSKNVIVITPPVARRAGWKDDETSVFYIKCKNEAELTDWCRVLKEVANNR